MTNDELRRGRGRGAGEGSERGELGIDDGEARGVAVATAYDGFFLGVEALDLVARGEDFGRGFVGHEVKGVSKDEDGAGDGDGGFELAIGDGEIAFGG